MRAGIAPRHSVGGFVQSSLVPTAGARSCGYYHLLYLGAALFVDTILGAAEPWEPQGGEPAGYAISSSREDLLSPVPSASLTINLSYFISGFPAAGASSRGGLRKITLFCTIAACLPLQLYKINILRVGASAPMAHLNAPTEQAATSKHQRGTADKREHPTKRDRAPAADGERTNPKPKNRTDQKRQRERRSGTKKEERQTEERPTDGDRINKRPKPQAARKTLRRLTRSTHPRLVLIQDKLYYIDK